MKNIINHKICSFAKKIFLSLLATSILIMPLQAYENHYGRGNSINAGFRLTIPFGPVKQNEDKVKYGLQMSFRREVGNYNFRSDGHMSGPRIFNGEIMALNFSENGFKSLSFAGQDRFIYQNGVFRAANEKEDEGMSDVTKGLLIGAGAVVILAGLGIGILVLSLPDD